VSGYLVFSVAALSDAVTVTATTWQDAIRQAAEAQQGSGRFVCVPTNTVQRARVDLTVDATATVTPDA
jgi:hypothetical protein